MKTCPVCTGKLYNIDSSYEVCDLHQDWLITLCRSCHRFCFSDVINICPRCLKLSSKNTVGGFSKNRRSILRKYGLE